MGTSGSDHLNQTVKFGTASPSAGRLHVKRCSGSHKISPTWDSGQKCSIR